MKKFKKFVKSIIAGGISIFSNSVPLTLLVLVVSLGVSAYGLLHLKIDSDTRNLLPYNDPIRVVGRKTEELYSTAHPIIVGARAKTGSILDLYKI